MAAAVTEAQMEKKLIEQLTQGANQWRLREDLKTIPQLWANFFQILEDNNRDQLHDVPLTPNEKETISTQITQSNFYKAAKFLAGANRQVRQHLKRDDFSLPDADLLILDNTNIAGGTSVYEVVHQVEVNKSSLSALDQDRRFDVTLLINGLPVIQIELKTPNFPFMDAFRQIQKYIDEDKFGNIYNFVEMLVVTNGTDTRYIPAGSTLSANFLITWIDQNKQPVNEYLEFAREVLSIPMAHHMIADYTVLDDNAQRIILLRPYQIQAILAIFRASREGKSGFVWHATGSGKTLTSYKVARNLLQIPAIDKTIFLIDRKDLDMQTVTAFQTYANNDTIDVDETANSFELAQQLGDGNRNVLVTTRQKLQAIFKRMENSPTIAKKYQKLKNLRLAFIVDECHRAVTPTQKRELDRFFNRQPLWYGFTGTPIFAENARAEKGQEARTTEQLYGPVLHKYTIEDAIHDHKVLGFKINNEGDFNQTDNDAIYLTDMHMKAVVQQTLLLAYRTQGLSNGHRYSALFSASSIKQAQKYYHLFQETIAKGEVPKRIQKVAPDFPRIAITYSISQNEEESMANQAEMKQALADYNKMFHTQFSMSELGSYNRNVNDRLACKNKTYQTHDQQLDIVIVVDRLLTGFDAPRLSTLYLDRPPMNPQNLIQAFSRTNRIYDLGKKWGQIVTFQYPDQYSDAIDKALTLYANGGTNGVLAPDWNTSRQRYLQSRQQLDNYIKNPKILEALIDAPQKEQKQFAKAFQAYDQALAAIKTYDELDKQDQLPTAEQINLEDISPELESTLEGKYQTIIDKLKADRKNDDKSTGLNIDEDYKMESIHMKEVDEFYIMSLIRNYIATANQSGQQVNVTQESPAPDEKLQVGDYIDQYAKTNEPRAKHIRFIWNDVQQDPQKYSHQRVEEVLENSIKQESQQVLVQLADDFGLDYDKLQYVMDNYDPDNSNPKGMENLVSRRYFDKFKEEHPNTQFQNFLDWKGQVRRQVKKVYETQIRPLTTEIS